MSRHRTPSLRTLELLEPRHLLAAAYPTALEQYHVELINRGRLDPAAEAARLNLGPQGINEGPVTNGGTVVVLPPGPRQPLAINPYLTEAAQKYARDLVLAGRLDHFLNGTNPGGRAATSGYTGGQAGYENLAWVAGVLSQATVESNYVNLFRDFIPGGPAVEGRGHRRNLLNGELTEVGVGNAAGGGKSFTAQDMARGPRYLTGVVFSDILKDDDFYTPGEGVGSITITATRQDNQVFTTSTWAAGGYSLQLGDGTYTVTASGGTLPEPVTFTNIVIAGQNRKVDFILGPLPPTPPDLTVQTSTFAGPDVLVPGDKARLGVLVTNQSGDSATGKITLSAYLSADATLDPADPLVGLVTASKFAAGKAGTTKAFSIPIAIAPGILPSSYHIIVTCVSDTITESDETNNTTLGGEVAVAWQAGNVGARRNVKLAYTLPGATTTNTLKLTGGGTATVQPNGSGAAITIASPTAKSALTLTTPAGQTAQLTGITSDGPMKSITAKTSTVQGNITIAGPLASLSLQNFAGGAITANTLGTLTATNIANASIDLPATGLDPANTKSFAMNRMTISGKAANLTLRSQGHINTITLGAADHVTIFAGVSPALTSLPDTADDFARPLRISKFTIKGLPAETFSTTALLLGASTVGSVTLTNVQTSNAGTPFGLAMQTLSSLTRVEGATKTKWTSKQPSSLLTSDGDLHYRFIPA